jgi:cysteine-rich repeat protein
MKFTGTIIFLISFIFILVSCDDSTSDNNVNSVNNINNSNNINNINNGYCGDGLIMGEEECDDNNMHSGDGCSSDCMLEYQCGDGVMEFSEECDGDDFKFNNCVMMGFLKGDLHCNECLLDISACSDDASELSILGWYRLDSLSGQEANSAGENNLCIVHALDEGAVIRDFPGKIGTSIFFDGSFGLRGFADCGPGYFGMNAITVEAWVEVGTYPLDLSMLVSSVSSYDATGLAFYLAINGDFKLEAGVGDWNSAVSSNSTIISREWHHVAFTYDGSEIALFIDGKLDNKVTHEVGIVPQLGLETSRVYIGNNYIHGMAEIEHFYTGTVDEIKIWEVARTEEDICFDAGGIYDSQNEICNFMTD